MSTLTTIQSTDLITDSRAVINNNFSALNADKMETSVLDTDTTLAANSDSKVATQKAVKAYVDAGGDATLQAALAGGGAFGTPSGTNKFITEDYLSSLPVSFGGTGVDGALSITSGTTTIDLGAQEIVYLNYTSVSITGTGKLAFSNKAAGGTLVYIRSQGNVTLTSSTVPLIDLDSIGGSGGALGGAGTDGFSSVGSLDGGAFSGYSSGVAVAGGISPKISRNAPRQIIFGTGGGGGASADAGANNGTGGAGGGALVIECAGALNFTGTIYARGAAGSAGGSGGSGGGGGGGSVHILYNTLTANSGTVTVTGGAAGAAGGTGSGDNGGGGGAGIATSGADSNATTRVGGAGGNGLSIIAQNLWF